MKNFSFVTAGKILFGRGQTQNAHELVRAFGHRILLVRGRSLEWVDGFSHRLQGADCNVFTCYSSGEPTLAQVAETLALGREQGIDVVVAVGGGSTIDLGKAVAALIPNRGKLLDYLEVVGKGQPLDVGPLPFVAIPTTAGTGAEVTKNAVISVPERGRKVSLRDDRMIADVAIIDPSLTDRSPRGVTLASGLDAITQVIEPYISAKANPLTDALCFDAIPRGFSALARLMATEDSGARDDLALTSLLGGLALANSGLGAVHGLAGVIGGRSGAPHGALCGRLLPSVLRMNRRRCAIENSSLERYLEVEAWIVSSLGGNTTQAFATLENKMDQWGLPKLSNLIPASSNLNAIAEEAKLSSSMSANPFPVGSEDLARALKEAG